MLGTILYVPAAAVVLAVISNAKMSSPSVAIEPAPVLVIVGLFALKYLRSYVKPPLGRASPFAASVAAIVDPLTRVYSSQPPKTYTSHDKDK